MKVLKFAVIFLLLNACRDSSERKTLVKAYNDSVISITKNYEDTAQFDRAIDFLDKAIEADSDFFDSYSKKVYLEGSLGLLPQASNTLRQMIRLKPDSTELYFISGFFADLTGDTITAREYYSIASSLYLQTLDTITRTNSEHHNLSRMTLLSLTMLGNDKMLKDFINRNCKNLLDSIYVGAEILSKSRKELLETAKQKYIR